MKKLTCLVLSTVLLFVLGLTVWGQAITPMPSPPPITPTPTNLTSLDIEGHVIDSATAKAVPYAKVRANASATLTDASGFYHMPNVLSTMGSAVNVEVSAPGYVTQIKSTGTTAGQWTIDFNLATNGELKVIIPGDVNSDGKVTIIDALLVAKYSAGFILTGFDTRAADVNVSGAPSSPGINVTDALIIAQYSAGIITNLISVQPAAGLPGDQIIITGTGFDPASNEVRFIANQSIQYFARAAVNSADGFRLTYTVPNYLRPYCYYDPLPCPAPDLFVIGGLYQITVTTSKGVSYAIPFVVNPF